MSVLLAAMLAKRSTGGGGIPTSGLIAHYTMDSISGSILNDEQSSYNLTINGTVTTETGVIGDALTFDGTNTYAEGGITLPNAFTVCGWVNFDSLSANRAVLAIGSGASPNRVFATADNKLYVSVNGGGAGFATVPISGLVGTDIFFCAVWRGNGNNMQISVNDGTPSTAPQTANYTNKSKLILGARRDTDYIDKMLGFEDQIRVYDRALTASEITAIYNEV